MLLSAVMYRKQIQSRKYTEMGEFPSLVLIILGPKLGMEAPSGNGMSQDNVMYII